ncbi:hypothetical protein ACFWXH_24340 [Mesorhizobium sp. NPDC059054]|uniref:hypothetical protein n=1 Tax=Mesorhizobium sp. NPDC059054 TaxID=3346711 RepID=UPI0036851033
MVLNAKRLRRNDPREPFCSGLGQHRRRPDIDNHPGFPFFCQLAIHPTYSKGGRIDVDGLGQPVHGEAQIASDRNDLDCFAGIGFKSTAGTLTGSKASGKTYVRAAMPSSKGACSGFSRARRFFCVEFADEQSDGVGN